MAVLEDNKRMICKDTHYYLEKLRDILLEQYSPNPTEEQANELLYLNHTIGYYQWFLGLDACSVEVDR